MIHFNFLKQLYCNTLTPFERLSLSKKVKINYVENESQPDLSVWKKCLSKSGSDATFKEYCKAQNITLDDLGMMLAEKISIEDSIEFPSWVYTLDSILERANTKIRISDENETKPFYLLLAPFINHFVDQLKIILSGNVPNQELIDQMCSALHKDLINISHQILFSEFTNYLKGKTLKPNEPRNFHFKRYCEDVLVDRYNDLFSRFPMLGRKLTVKTQNYIQFIARMLSQLEEDKFEIEVKLDVTLGSLKKLYLNSGDQHNGESTVVLEFDENLKVVYKPGDLAISSAYHTFVEWVNSKLGCQLKPFAVINKGEYGWLEYVENLSCETKEEIRNYYEKAGILSGIAYFLNARDYHYENLIASGDSPVLIDHETILNPIIQKKHREPNDFKVGTILETLLLPIPNDIDPPYISGFGSSVHTHRKNYIPKIQNINSDSMQTVPELITNELFKSNKPKIGDKIENLSDYQDEFKNGFNRLYQLIKSNREFLLSVDSPLNHFKDLKVRLIYRSTGVYLKILRSLNSPQYLNSAINYGIRIELLARAYAVSGNWSPILGVERTQMLNGDVPAFYVSTIDKSLRLENGEIGEIFACNALEVIRHKIKNAEESDYSNQMKLIEEVIEL